MSTSDSFGSAFRAAMEALGYGEAPERRLTPAEVSQLAMERAGTTDKKSRAYKSARRTLERRRTTGKQSRGQVNRRFARRVRERGLRVHAELEIDPSPGAQEDFRPRTIDVEIPGSRLGRMADALDRGDLDAAESAFLQALLREYEGAGEGASFLAGAVIGEVDALDIAWGEGAGGEESDEYDDYE